MNVKSCLESINVWPETISEKALVKEGPHVKSSERLSAQLHCRPGENAGVPTEELVEKHPGGSRASWRTPGLWPSTMEPGVAIDLHRDGPGLATHWRPANADQDDRCLSDSDSF